MNNNQFTHEREWSETGEVKANREAWLEHADALKWKISNRNERIAVHSRICDEARDKRGKMPDYVLNALFHSIATVSVPDEEE